jgi:preprotein translocase subunit YajC
MDYLKGKNVFTNGGASGIVKIIKKEIKTLEKGLTASFPTRLRFEIENTTKPPVRWFFFLKKEFESKLSFLF